MLPADSCAVPAASLRAANEKAGTIFHTRCFAVHDDRAKRNRQPDGYLARQDSAWILRAVVADTSSSGIKGICGVEAADSGVGAAGRRLGVRHPSIAKLPSMDANLIGLRRTLAGNPRLRGGQRLPSLECP
jgi:hypothetical protein